MDFLKKILGISSDEEQTLREAIDRGAIVVDVRSPAEFASGHPKGAKNIPLQDLAHRLDEIKALNKPVVLCCASGVRSANAKSILHNAGIAEVYNAGPWKCVPC